MRICLVAPFLVIVSSWASLFREMCRQRQMTHSVKKMKPENFLVFAVAFLCSLYSQAITKCIFSHSPFCIAFDIRTKLYAGATPLWIKIKSKNTNRLFFQSFTDSKQKKKNSSSFMHSVWKSQKKSHSTLRAKRACYIVSGQKLIKNVKIGPFLILWSNSVTRYVYFIRDKNWLKMPINATFWVSLNNMGLTPLHYACKIGHINIVTVSIFASILKCRKT